MFWVLVQPSFVELFSKSPSLDGPMLGESWKAEWDSTIFLKFSVRHQRLLKFTLLTLICCLTLGHCEAAGWNSSRFHWIACLQPGTGWEVLTYTTEAKSTDGAGTLITEVGSDGWKIQLPFYLQELYFILTLPCFTQGFSYWLPACCSTATSGPPPDTDAIISHSIF